MGKLTEDKLKVIFKTSKTTLCTHSKTCSGISQLSTKSAMLRIQKDLRKQHSYYVDRGKVKRDLSLETDICVLRRFCRQKLNMTSNLASSAKSKYSAIETEIDTVEEFPDTSACGDNEIIEIRSNYHTDLECLMVDNLKNLLGQWIQKHLVQNKDTKQKLDTVFDSIINKLNDKTEQEISSDTTYVIHKEAQNQEVKNKKIATASVICHRCKHKSCYRLVTSASSQKDISSAPIPSPKKDMRMISTLSIPRSFHKRGIDGQKKNNSSCKLGKIKRKNIILSIDKFNRLLDSSSFDLLAVSTKSLTQRFANYDVHFKKKKHISFFPKPFYKSATCSANIFNPENVKDCRKGHLDPLPSLLRSLYRNDSAIIASSLDKNFQFDTKNDNFTMTENFSRESVGNKDMKCLNVKKNTCTSTSHVQLPIKKSTKLGKVNKRRKQVFGNKITPNCSQLKYLNSRHFTFMYEKATKQILQGQDLANYWKNFFHYFSKLNANKNIHVDIHITLSPEGEYETKDACTTVSHNVCDTYVTQGDPTLLYNVKPETEITNVQPEILKSQLEIINDTIVTSTCAPEIIPLLDGAVSQAKYIFPANSGEKVEMEANMIEDRGKITSELEILQEISELKVVIKDLAMTTEKLVGKQKIQRNKKKDTITSNAYPSFNASYNFTSSSRCEAVVNLRNPSKATQVLPNFKRNQTKSHTITLEDSKTKDTLEYYNRLTKKSTSFRIIDSESLLRVTDMTSKANEINKFNRQITDEALTCSLPKSMSLFELPTERNKKLIAFFCDNCVKPKANMGGHSSNRNMPGRPRNPCKKKNKWSLFTNKKKDIYCPRSISGSSCVIPINPETVGAYSSASSCHSACSIIEDEEEGKPCRTPRGMGFGEGCMYCMLLWIPVIIIACLFYSHVLKNYIVSEDKIVIGRKALKSVSPRNSTVVYLKLSELGF